MIEIIESEDFMEIEKIELDEVLDHINKYANYCKTTHNVIHEKKDGTFVTATTISDSGSLKNEINLIIFNKDGIPSKAFTVDGLKEDLYTECKKLMGVAGLKALDIQKIAKVIGDKQSEFVVKNDNSVNMGDLLKLVYDKFLIEAKVINDLVDDEELRNSILIKNGCYMLRANTLRRIVEDLGGVYKDLTKHLIISDLLVNSTANRYTPSVDILGNKIHVYSINMKKMHMIFGDEGISVIYE